MELQAHLKRALWVSGSHGFSKMKNIEESGTSLLRSIGGASNSSSGYEVGSSSNSEEVHYDLSDDSDDNLEMEDMGDLSEGDESANDDVVLED
jgi:hypothetical protein